jgi:hypothetical protein
MTERIFIEFGLGGHCIKIRRHGFHLRQCQSNKAVASVKLVRKFKEQRTGKQVPMCAKAGTPLTHQSINLLHTESSALLVEPLWPGCSTAN